MARLCAYCDTAAPMTREHVWPACFLERFGRRVAKFSVRASKVHGADYVVRDVCTECNSKRLAELDSYFCTLHDKYFAELRDFNAVVRFEYDFDLLARALLKIAYNTARAGVSDPAPLANVRRFIIGQEAPPHQLAIFIELLSPTILEDCRGPVITTRKVFPQMFRSALTEFSSPGGDDVLTRIVGVNSFFFHLVVPREPMLVTAFEEIVSAFGSSIQGLVRLEPLLGQVTVATSPQDGPGSFLPHLEAFRDQYGAYFARERDQ
jgi:hypothetical protein